jgi:hypothetical protein
MNGFLERMELEGLLDASPWDARRRRFRIAALETLASLVARQFGITVDARLDVFALVGDLVAMDESPIHTLDDLLEVLEAMASKIPALPRDEDALIEHLETAILVSEWIFPWRVGVPRARFEKRVMPDRLPRKRSWSGPM